MIHNGIYTLGRATIDDASGCALIVDNWIAKTVEMPRLFDKHKLTEMIRDAIPLREVWVIGEPINGDISYNSDSLQISALNVNKKGEGHGKILLDQIKADHKFPNCGAMKLIIQHMSFIEDKDLSSKIEKTAVQMEYRNYNSGGLKSK